MNGRQKNAGDKPVLKGVGIDLVCIRRIRRVYKRRPTRFLNRIFTEKEIALFKAKANPFPSMAARFAAKEAVAKALGCGIGRVGWRDLEILSVAGGKPVVCLQGAAQALAKKKGIRGIEISLSHDNFYAVAQAVAY
ncbi:MAG: holo-ACP synthase [Dethiobacteria bacterium]|jgi:holo-[acyl-carrier protein] synthase